MTNPDHSESELDAFVSAVLPNGDTELRAMFEAQGTKAPQILWSPNLSDLNNPQILDFAKTCLTLAGSTTPIREADFDLGDFSAFLPWLLIVNVEDGGKVFRYSHYGEGIASVRGISMLGRTSADFGGYISLFFTATYLAILRQKNWLLTVHTPPKEIFARHWERLIVPLVNDQNEVTRFICLNIPDNDLRAGLEIIPDPVMILDADQIVRYANRAARTVFDRNEFQAQDMSLFKYSGIDLQIAQTPSELVRKHAVHDKVCLAMRQSLLQDFLVTISGAKLWGNSFYVLTLRMDVRTR